MGTRGSIGVVVDGEFKGAYNHFDSYPDGLGRDMVEQARTIAKSLDHYRQAAKNLRMVKETDPVTAADLETYKYLRGEQSDNLGESGHNPNAERYSLLRDMQGELVKTLDAGIMLDGSTFVGDSLFCEYAYIVNFDDGTIEMYEGFQKDASKIEGRFKSMPFDRGYGPVSLKGTFPLADIPDNWMALAFPPDPEDDDPA